MKQKEELKNFFLKLTIIKSNFKATIIATIILMLYCLIMGIILFSKSNNLFEFKART